MRWAPGMALRTGPRGVDDDEFFALDHGLQRHPRERDRVVTGCRHAFPGASWPKTRPFPNSAARAYPQILLRRPFCFSAARGLDCRLNSPPAAPLKNKKKGGVVWGAAAINRPPLTGFEPAQSCRSSRPGVGPEGSQIIRVRSSFQAAHSRKASDKEGPAQSRVPCLAPEGQSRERRPAPQRRVQRLKTPRPEVRRSTLSILLVLSPVNRAFSAQNGFWLINPGRCPTAIELRNLSQSTITM